MPKRKKSPLVTDRDGKTLFVRLNASGITPLVALVDGLPLTFFGKKDGPYITVERAAEWHERELKESGGRSGDKEIAVAMRQMLDKFRRGEVEIRG